MVYFVNMFDESFKTWVTICSSYRYSYVDRFYREMKKAFPKVNFKLCEVLDYA